MKFLPLKQISDVLDVRVALDPERVNMFRGLLREGVKLRPIKVVRRKGKYIIIDGRHRYAAYELEGIANIPAVVIDDMSDTEMWFAAFNANTGGSLPPRIEDINHTIHRLMDRGLSEKEIVAGFSSYPVSVAKKMVHSGANIVRLGRARKAASAVRSGMNVNDAVRKFKASRTQTLRELGERDSGKAITTITHKRTALSNQYKAHSRKNTESLKWMLAQRDDGVPGFTDDAIMDFLLRMKALAKHHLKQIEDHIKRFKNSLNIQSLKKAA